MSDRPSTTSAPSSMVSIALRVRDWNRWVALIAAVAAAGWIAAGLVVYCIEAPKIARLTGVELALRRPADVQALHDSLRWDFILIAMYGIGLIVLCALARMMAWTKTSQRLTVAGLACAAVAVFADLFEDLFLWLGSRADRWYDVAGGFSAIKWAAIVPAALVAAAGFVLTVVRALFNTQTQLDKARDQVTTVWPPLPLETAPTPVASGSAADGKAHRGGRSGLVGRAGAAPKQRHAAARSTEKPARERWRNAYRVPECENNAYRVKRSTAICLSGGGIRSATVALGALQALRQEVKKADYVISVSGGGYTAGALVQAMTGANAPSGDVERDPDSLLAEGSAFEDYIRRHSSYLASTAARLVQALVMIGRGLLGSLFVLFAPTIFLGVAVGLFYKYVPISQLSQITVPASSTHVAFPTLNPIGLWTTLAVAGAGTLVWMSTVIIVGFRDWDPRANLCRSLQFCSTGLWALAGIIGTFVILLPTLTFVCAWLYAHTSPGAGLGVHIAAPIVAVLLSYLVTARSVLWKNRKRISSLFHRGAAPGGAAPGAPMSVIQMLLIAAILALLSAIWLLVFGVAASTHIDATALWTAGGVLAGWAFVAGLVDETALSLHPFYRRRLASAFALRVVDGQAAPYPPAERTSLDKYAKVDDANAPRFVFAAAANLVDDDRTAPGLRAVSYVLTHDWIGGPDIGWVATSDAINACPAVIKRDLTVQAAVAISGAAFASAMGRASSWYGSLLAISGARLGSWLPHPDYLLLRAEAQDWTLPGMPHVRRFTYLLREVFGIHPYFQRLLNVTDGGHYENLGLVEALRRRCRLIYVIDASGDSPPTATTFAAAMRLAKDELGVTITPVDPLDLEPGTATPLSPKKPLSSLDSRLSKTGVIVADVAYPSESGLPPGRREGRLIYAKASLWPQLPYQVLSYAAKSETFPHDSTADQWFDEGKFSSYKRLGYSLGELAKARPNAADLGRPAPAPAGGAPAPPGAEWVAPVSDLDGPLTVTRTTSHRWQFKLGRR